MLGDFTIETLQRYVKDIKSFIAIFTTGGLLNHCAHNALHHYRKLSIQQHDIFYRWTKSKSSTRTRTNTNPNDTEANAAGRSGNARALRKQSKCGVYHESKSSSQ